MIIAEHTVTVKGDANRKLSLIYLGSDTLDVIEILGVTNAFQEYARQWLTKPLTAYRANLELRRHAENMLRHVQAVDHECVASMTVEVTSLSSELEHELEAVDVSTQWGVIRFYVYCSAEGRSLISSHDKEVISLAFRRRLEHHLPRKPHHITEANRNHIAQETFNDLHKLYKEIHAWTHHVAVSWRETP